MKRAVLLSAFFILAPLCSQAEYRVFLLKISKRAPASDQPSQTNSTELESAQDYRLVESTLDHIQYKYYYPVAADEEVTYIETWRCYGRTDDFKPHCPNPKGQIPTETTPQS